MQNILLSHSVWPLMQLILKSSTLAKTTVGTAAAESLEQASEILFMEHFITPGRVA